MPKIIKKNYLLNSICSKVFFALFKALISSSVEGIFNFWINLSASSPVNVGVGSTLVAIIKSPYDIFNKYYIDYYFR